MEWSPIRVFRQQNTRAAIGDNIPGYRLVTIEVNRTTKSVTLVIMFGVAARTTQSPSTPLPSYSSTKTLFLTNKGLFGRVHRKSWFNPYKMAHPRSNSGDPGGRQADYVQ